MKTTKITLATVKSFMKKNAGNIYIKVKSHFYGMTDCVQPLDDGFIKAQGDSTNNDHNYGIAGAWFVGQSRDHFQAFEDDNFTGFEVSNSCGSFVLAVLKEGATAPVEDMGTITISPKIAEQTEIEKWSPAIVAAEQSAEYAGWVGKAVIRKACKRNGEVVAIEGDKVTVQLADGSVRKPNATRFQKLYNFA